MNKLTTCTLLLLCLYGCAGRRIQPGEEALAADFSGRNWWLGSGVSEDSLRGDIHLNFLLMPDRVNGKPFTACYASVWMEKDSSFWYGCFFADSVSAGKEGKKLNASTYYSTAENKNWYINLGRSSLALRGTLQNKKGDLSRDMPLSFIFHFPRQNPFHTFDNDHGLNTTFVTRLGTGQSRSRLGEEAWKGTFHLRVLKDAGDRLFPSDEANSKPRTFTWMELDMDTGEHLVILSDKPTHNFGERPGVVCIQPDGSLIEEKKEFILESEGFLVSPLADKAFIIYYKLDAPASNSYFRISPRAAHQVIPMKNNAFWMGAVEVTDRMKLKPAGKGNMFIFSSQ